MRCRLPFCALLALSLSFASSAFAAVWGDPVGSPYLVEDIEPSGEPLTITIPYFGDSVHLYGSNPHQLTPWRGALYFVAHDFEHGVELWRSNGTTEGTRRVADVCPGTCWGGLTIVGTVGNVLVFWADDGVHGTELWATDGTSAGTRLLADLCPGACSLTCPGACDSFGESHPHGLWIDPSFIAPGHLWRGELHFEVWTPAADPATGRYATLWKTDGTPEGTVQVLDPCAHGGCASDIGEMVEAGDSLLVSVQGSFPSESSPSEPDAIYRFVAGSAGARLVARGCEKLPSFIAEELTPVGGVVVFVSTCLEGVPGSKVEGRHLFATDGTAAGTVLLNTGSPDLRVQPRELVALGDRVYFVRGSRLHDGAARVLWRTDGTPAGTRRHTIERLPSTMVRLARHGSELLMLGLDEEENVVTWTTEGGVSAVRRLLENAGLPTPIADRLLFTRAGGGYADELWMTDANGSELRQITNLRPHTRGSYPRDLVPLGDRVFFTADDGEHGRELWALPFAGAGDPPPPPPPPAPPAGPWASDTTLPGFRVKARIHAGGTEIAARHEPTCIPETLCLSGALPGRTELLVRVVGPKPNGRLWPTLVRFSTSTIEVWIEQTSTGEVEFYRLDGATPGSSDLTGRFDREGFAP